METLSLIHDMSFHSTSTSLSSSNTSSLSLTSSTNALSETETVTCCVCLDPSLSLSQTISHPCSIDPSGDRELVTERICLLCLEGYIESKLSSAYKGSCPVISCPICPPSRANKTIPIFPYDIWTSICPSSESKYETLAKSLLSLQCSSCHARKSLLVDYDSTGLSSLQQYLTPGISSEGVLTSSDETLQLFLSDLKLFSSGQLSVTEFYDLLISKHLVNLPHLSSKDSWNIFKTLLSTLPNPERRANLHLRYLRSRSTAYLTCCNKEQCYRCRTRDTHPGMTCEQMEKQHDNGLVRCSQCSVYLVKGDGCDSVTCVCGKQFSWSTERQNFDSSRAFLESFPEQTAVMYARVLCEIDGSTLCNLSLAEAWGRLNELESVRALTTWWKENFSPCPSQRSVLPSCQPVTSGASRAMSLWQQTHSLEVSKCRSERENALNSLISSYFPDYCDRIAFNSLRRKDQFGVALRESILSHLPEIDRKNLLDVIKKFRPTSLQAPDQISFSCSFDPNLNPAASLSLSELERHFYSTRQFLFLYGHRTAELLQIEVRIPKNIDSKTLKRTNRVTEMGPVFCRFYTSSHRSEFVPAEVTRFNHGNFDLMYTDSHGVKHLYRDLIFSTSLSPYSCAYLPKYHSIDSAPPSGSFSPKSRHCVKNASDYFKRMRHLYVKQKNSGRGGGRGEWERGGRGGGGRGGERVGRRDGDGLWVACYLPSVSLSMNAEHYEMLQSFRICLHFSKEIVRLHSEMIKSPDNAPTSPSLISLLSFLSSLSLSEEEMLLRYRSVCPLVRLMDPTLCREREREDHEPTEGGGEVAEGLEEVAQDLEGAEEREQRERDERKQIKRNQREERKRQVTDYTQQTPTHRHRHRHTETQREQKRRSWRDVFEAIIWKASCPS